MFTETDAVANVAVKDIDVARKFYRDVLGLTQVHAEGGEVLVFRSGNSHINVYRSDYAGTNKATAITWAVDNVQDTVRALEAHGVPFEHYDMPGLTREGHVHSHGAMQVAWFKDPDGNILNVMRQPSS